MREAFVNFRKNPRERKYVKEPLADLLSEGILQKKDLQGEMHEIYWELLARERQLGAGEAARIACAAITRHALAIDEPSVRDICRDRFTNITTLTTVDLLRNVQSNAAVDSEALTESVFNAQTLARMRVDAKYVEWVISLIGAEKPIFAPICEVIGSNRPYLEGRGGSLGGIMAAKGFVYRAVSCGVNLSHGQKPLAYAEADAEAMYRTYTSALGPADSESSLLLTGNMASRTSVVQRLSRLAQLRTDYLLFYFSGHGSEDGIALADGILDYGLLHQLLGRIRARASLVILDACHSGAYGYEHVDVAGGGESWADVLARTMPGERMFFATRPDENAAEGGDIQGGHFTWALLEALHRGQGELRSTTGSRFLSDTETFALTNATLRKRWPDDALPSCMNLAGDFPMLKSHAEVPIGAGEVAITPLPRQIAVNVTVRIFGRAGVPVKLRSRLLDPNGILVADETRQLIPKANNSVGTYSIDLTAVAHTSHLRFYQDRVPLQWVVELVDPWHRYVLGHANLTLAYKSGNSSVRSPVGY